MDSSRVPPLRSLPRVFIEIPAEVGDLIDLPPHEFKKFHDVLRLRSGAQVAVLPNNGQIMRCEMAGRQVKVLEIFDHPTESARNIHLYQAMPKPEKLEEIVRMSSELGVASITVFESDRSVVRWDGNKKADRTRRLQSIAIEAAEVSFRAKYPKVRWMSGVKEVLDQPGSTIVLSEGDQITKTLSEALDGASEANLVIGPEGGWAPREVALIGPFAVTLGPRVLRVDTAAVTACAIALSL